MEIIRDLYQKKYNYKVVEPLPEYFAVDEIREKYQCEPYKARRKIFKALLEEKEAMVALCCDRIQLQMRWLGSPYDHLFLEEDGLYAGYIHGRLPYVRKINSYGEPQVPLYLSIFTGELPPNIIKTYEKAKKYFSKKELIVVSRDPRLFDIREIAPKVSPLLIAMSKKTNKQYLLAAWGLEHELPKSLGGLLEG